MLVEYGPWPIAPLNISVKIYTVNVGVFPLQIHSILVITDMANNVEQMKVL